MLGVPNLHRFALASGVDDISQAGVLNADVLGELARHRVEGVMILDPNLSTREAQSAGDHDARGEALTVAARTFVEALRPVYRELAQMGVTTIMHAEMGPAAWMFRSACAELCQDLSESDPLERQRARWILRRMLSYVAVPRNSAMARLLPRQLKAAIPWRAEAIGLFSSGANAHVG